YYWDKTAHGRSDRCGTIDRTDTPPPVRAPRKLPLSPTTFTPDAVKPYRLGVDAIATPPKGHPPTPPTPSDGFAHARSNPRDLYLPFIARGPRRPIKGRLSVGPTSTSKS
ncbi:MAG: hypothetical protein ABF266_02305, partial [Celeribacter marinus]